MEVKTADFIGSFVKTEQCPKPDKPEYAFIGRSNVGKSSLINMLADNRKLAKTSNTPGKTQTINHFLINHSWYLVDLPGYGYAKISKTARAKWEKMIKHYLVKRENLMCVFVLIDSRHLPMEVDIDFINKLGEYRVPFVLVFTKADKQSPNQTQSNIAAFRRKMKESWTDVPQSFITSATTKEGKEEILAFIAETNEKFLAND